MSQSLVILVLAILGVPLLVILLWMVHCALDRLCVRHAKKLCSRNGLKTHQVRWRPQFDASGVKTEFTLVQLDCLDPQQQRRLVSLSVWPLGVRETISDEPYPSIDDDQWPQATQLL